MTQAELAVRLNLGRTSITNLEKGLHSPPLSLLPDIASALGIDPWLLVSEALRGDVAADAGTLAATVHDEDLRRWAGQVIGGTPTLQAPSARSPRTKARPT